MSSWIKGQTVDLSEPDAQAPDEQSKAKNESWIKGQTVKLEEGETQETDESPASPTVSKSPAISGIAEDGGPRPVVFCGPSGVGKGTLIDLLMKRFPEIDPETNLPAPVGDDGKPVEGDGKKSKKQFGFSVSHTTRAPREGEVDGTHYNFTTVDAIKKEIDDGKFVEYAEVHGNYYGTSVAAVESVRGEGMICVLDIDVQGVRNVKKSNLNPIYIFISPPSMDELEKRLRGRGTEKEESIKKRLANAKAEMDYGNEAGNFDMVLVNSDLKVTFEELAKTFKEWYPSLVEVAPDDEAKSCQDRCVIS